MPRPLRSLAIAALLGAALGAGGVVALAEPPKGGYPPDPPAHPSRANCVFEMSARGGKVTIDRVKAIMYEKPA